jgi:oligopeptide transport system permease protein
MDEPNPYSTAIQDRHEPHDLERYAKLLADARSVRGVSLAAEAWRRLRRKKIAMLALLFLVTLSLAAFFTPLLPLQSPYNVDTALSYLPPTIHARQADALEISKNQPGVRTGDAKAPAENPAWIEKQFGHVGRLNRWMIQARVAIFGTRSIPSLCGRDELGRDVLSRLFWGARVSLAVGLVATLVSVVIGISYGAIAGYLGGWVDDLMMRVVDILYSVPFIFIVIYLITILSEHAIQAWLEAHGIDRIAIFFIVVGAIYWLTMARVVRGQILSLKHEQFVEAARTIGASQGRIIFRHLVPNVLSVVIVYLTLTIPRVMLLEAFLSFLGLGVQAPDVSWGLLANEGFLVITPIKIFWWLFLFPALALGMTLFCLNFLGDGLRDALDPKLKNK